MVINNNVLGSMDSKKLIWIVGGMASGKSTLRDHLIENLSTRTPKLISNDFQEYVDCGKLAALGNCLKSNQCNGLDSSFGKLKKDGAIRNVEYCVKNFQTTLVEGSQTSAQWIIPLCEICLKYDCEFVLIHLDLRLWENYKRLVNRLLTSGKTEEDVTDSKLDSIRAKNSQAKFISLQCRKTEFVKVISVNTEGLTAKQTLKQILKQL